MLIRQMERKFDMRPHQRRHIETAYADSLLAWSENILTAERPEDVLR